MGSRVLVLGASGKGNFGDEFLAWILVKLLHSINQNINGTILTFNKAVSEDFFIHDSFSYSNYYLYFPSLKYIRSFFLFKTIREFKDYSVAVFPGGGFIYDYSFSTLLSWYRKFLALRRIRLPILLIGVGIGPLRTSFSKVIARRILNLCDFCIVRDKKSFELAQVLKIEQNKLKLGADLSIVLNKFIDFSFTKKPKSKKCLVVPRFWPYRHTENNDKLLMKAMIKLIAYATYYFKFDNIIFLPMHRFDDIPLCQKLSSAIHVSSAFLKIRALKDIISPLSEAGFTISMRYHGALLSLIAGKPVLSISYDDKVENLMNDFNRADHNINWQIFLNSDQDVIFKHFDNIRNDNLKDIPKLVKELQDRLVYSINELSKYFC